MWFLKRSESACSLAVLGGGKGARASSEGRGYFLSVLQLGDVMGGKAHHPSSSESDYWNDESWTVDCPCGVSFDDGEEMVECDECGVWVHTACCRVPKGLTTFVCDKCKCKKKKESEEAPEHLPPRHASPTDLPSSDAVAGALHPNDMLRKPANEVPMHERVHVQGPPGGDPQLFQDVSRVFSQQLWKFTGYQPKSFHTKCKEIPTWTSPDDPAERLLSLLSSRKEVISFFLLRTCLRVTVEVVIRFVVFGCPLLGYTLWYSDVDGFCSGSGVGGDEGRCEGF